MLSFLLLGFVMSPLIVSVVCLALFRGVEYVERLFDFAPVASEYPLAAVALRLGGMLTEGEACKNRV